MKTLARFVVVLSACSTLVLAASVRAQDLDGEENGDQTRGVRIIEGPQQSPVPVAPPMRVDQASLKAENPAGLALDILPGTEFNVGSQISFRIASKRPGYLILVDVDATGKLSQIYPNAAALLTPQAATGAVNRIIPGQTVTIPQVGNPYSGFAYVVSPPSGVAMTLAVLSDQPVQVIDLPDVPPNMVGRADALKYLTDAAQTLRVAGTGRGFAVPKWSFDAKFYVVK